MSQISLPATLSTTSKTRPGWSASGSGPGCTPWLRARSKISRATQVGACTPLVIEVIGRSSASKLRPEPAEHAAADHAVQLGDAVGALREPEAHHRHVEHRRVAALEVLRAERQDPVDRDAVAGVLAAEVLRDQVLREPVDAGRHRRVRGEHGAGAGDLEGRVEGRGRCPR